MEQKTSPARAITAAVLLILGATMMPITLLSVWLKSSVFDEDQFVALYQPVAGKSDFQNFVAGKVADKAASVVEDSPIASGASAAASSIDQFLEQHGLSSNLAEATQGWSDKATEAVRKTIYEQTAPIVKSSGFSAEWADALRQIHSQTFAALEGEGDGTLQIQAAPFVEDLRANLTDEGNPLAALLPELDSSTTIPLGQVEFSEKWQTAYHLVDQYGAWLPWINAGLILLGLLRANHRLLALARTAFFSAVLFGGMWFAVPRLSNKVLITEDPEVAQLLWQTGSAPLQALAGYAGIIALAISLLAGAFHLTTRKN